MKRYGYWICAALAVLLVFTAMAFSSCGDAETTGPRDATESSGEDALSGDFSFLVCGDPHGRTDLLEEIVAQAGEGEFLVVVGDITTGKGLQEMQGMKDYLDGTGIEYYTVPGDNDMPGGDSSTYEAVFGPDHYAVDSRGAHLVFLNDAVQGVGCSDEELAWLQEDLAAVEEGRLILAFAHVPPGAPVDMGKSGFVEEETESNRTMLDMLGEAGAPVIYCGHLHAYMLYSSGPPRVVVTGGAGGNPHLSEQSGGYHHFLRVTVTGGEVSEEIIRL
ncbi:MAG: metallophosphoesterase [Actinobacteria bacterium]|nr:metallophosphoesterase [Actinomycetota bacterium]